MAHLAASADNPVTPPVPKELLLRAVDGVLGLRPVVVTAGDWRSWSLSPERLDSEPDS